MKTVQANPDLKPCSDAELRAMRDAIYPPTSTENVQTTETWEQVKSHWRKDEAWLTEQYGKLKA